MANNVIIRAAGLNDIPVLSAIYNQPMVVAGTLGIPFQTPDDTQQRFRFDPSNRHLVAELDGQLVGSAGMHLNRGRRGHSASIGMAVADTYQGQGIGTALMRALIDLADNWYNLLRIDLQVYTDNEPAIHLYRRFGFEIEGTLRSYAYRAGEFVDAYYMARLRNCPPVLFDAGTITDHETNDAS